MAQFDETVDWGTYGGWGVVVGGVNVLPAAPYPVYTGWAARR